ncbi:hypothetical protein [Photobacterium leiognathi]|uniref:hypothetical protein n=1 Tax=Photobacterium leiognathi TaxID=553611 RepID=UPI002980B45A|nr:hypothetical protein [Photobacterium leiognathi]
MQWRKMMGYSLHAYPADQGNHHQAKKNNLLVKTVGIDTLDSISGMLDIQEVLELNNTISTQKNYYGIMLNNTFYKLEDMINFMNNTPEIEHVTSVQELLSQYINATTEKPVDGKYLITKTVTLHENIAGRPSNKTFDFSPSRLTYLSISNTYKTHVSPNGITYYQQEIYLNPNHTYATHCWVSQNELENNGDLVFLPLSDHTIRYEVLEDVVGHDNCYNAPKNLTIPKGSIIQLNDEYCTRRGDHFFTINGDKNNCLASRHLFVTTAPFSRSHYNPTLLKTI